MNESYSINNILEAVEDLNNKKKITKTSIKSNVLKSDDVPPQVDQIIREAEKYKNQITSKLNLKSR
jgi:hypothetical protein